MTRKRQPEVAQQQIFVTKSVLEKNGGIFAIENAEIHARGRLATWGGRDGVESGYAENGRTKKQFFTDLSDAKVYAEQACGKAIENIEARISSLQVEILRLKALEF